MFFVHDALEEKKIKSGSLLIQLLKEKGIRYKMMMVNDEAKMHKVEEASAPMHNKHTGETLNVYYEINS